MKRLTPGQVQRRAVQVVLLAMRPVRPSTGGPDGGAKQPCPRPVVEAARTPALRACNPASAPPTSAAGAIAT
eukprot:3959516-Pleurochrysis_carterae.AAC.1